MNAWTTRMVYKHYKLTERFILFHSFWLTLWIWIHFSAQDIIRQICMFSYRWPISLQKVLSWLTCWYTLMRLRVFFFPGLALRFRRAMLAAMLVGDWGGSFLSSSSIFSAARFLDTWKITYAVKWLLSQQNLQCQKNGQYFQDMT